MKVLDMACGSAKTPGAIGIDFNPDSAADIIHDLNVFPYPFADDTFDRIVCHHGLEHLDNVVRVMEEVHRISRPGAVIEIAVPHFSSASFHTDPTHKHAFTSLSMDYFVPGTQLFQFKYSQARFRKRRVRVLFYYETLIGQLWQRALQKLINRNGGIQRAYDRHFAYLCPAHQVVFELETLKGS